ncbi:hypothetical protein NDU88_005326 [Pleurodeles waltl]|uniref:Uncharacterized protein n=1 Tax=Pleurodeles waltl TaxID=8319 RepID=A0AAV7TAD3_PLEWA|nr:hypothetical protein NDU88_005326 [Pleurodeles waltl]
MGHTWQLGGPEDYSPQHLLRQEPRLFMPSGASKEAVLPALRDIPGSWGAPEDYSPKHLLQQERGCLCQSALLRRQHCPMNGTFLATEGDQRTPAPLAAGAMAVHAIRRLLGGRVARCAVHTWQPGGHLPLSSVI